MKDPQNIALGGNLSFTTRKWYWVAIIFFLIYGGNIYGQQAAKHPKESLLQLLTTNLEEGDLIALRDLAKLYDKNPKDEVISQLLKRYTLLTKEEFDWEQPKELQSFTQFFYKKAEAFHFSELLKVFYLSPIESWSATFDIDAKKAKLFDPFLIRESVKSIGDYLKKKEITLLTKEVRKLGSIKNPTVYIVLSDLLRNKALKSLKKVHQEEVVAEVLIQLPDSLSFQKLLDLTKKEFFSLAYCQRQLALLSNNFFHAENHQELVSAYKKLSKDFDNNIISMKAYGYKKTNLTPKMFFEEKVDYYGWILATSKDSLFWIQRSAIKDMLALKDPKVLFYIAGLNFKYWKMSGSNNPGLTNLLDELIDVKVKIQKEGIDETTPQTLSGQEQLIHYWSIHYEDYEWDVYEQKFVNQLLFSNELAEYDRYFRRLNSTNDSIAFKAFVALCRGKPNEISELIKKFKPLLRNYNAKLPPLKYKILEQVSLLTHFCNQQRINYIPNEKLQSSFRQLANKIPSQERWRLENELIEQLTIHDLTTIEYYAAINAHNIDLNYSLGRILDYGYTKYWKDILGNEHYFRLFLLKAELFRGFGGFGISKKYENKIDLTNLRTISLLNSLKVLETNPYIQQSIQYFLNQKQERSVKKEIADFLSAPKGIDKERLKALPPFDKQDLPKIIQELFLQEDKKATKNIGTYIELYASLEMIPQLFEMPEKQWVANKYAGIALVKVLEKVYQFSFATKQQESIKRWWKLWNTIPENYLEWSEYLFREQLDKLHNSEELTIEHINAVTRATFYKPMHRKVCLESLQKVKKSRTIYRLQIEPKISVETELKYLENIPFSTKELRNLPKIFKIESPQILLDFIYEQSKKATIEEKSALYNALFRQAWFINHIRSGEIDPQKCDAIKLIFYQYLSQSTFLTEYEEQITQLNIVHLENAFLSLKEKLIRISKDSLNETIRYDYLNATLSRMEFPEIMLAFPILKDLEIANHNLFLFLNRDFGLPIFEVPTEKAAQKIMNQLKIYSEYEFYEQTLIDFGLPILNKEGTLDFQKIYQLLTYDLVVPFLGEGGKYRDYYTYGLVKLLELHFKTTLGFYPKLNENQTFYTFNSYKRVEAWRAYLLEQKLVEKNGNLSFK